MNRINHILLIFLSLNLTYNCYAQSFFPDETQQQKWELLSFSWGGCYTSIIKNGNAVNFCQNKFIEVFTCDENEQNCILNGYYTLRNDSVILRANMNCNDPELTLYVFNANVGDTLRCATNYNPFSKFWVKHKQPIIYEGIPRNTYSMGYWPFISQPTYSHYNMKWIEGIGSDTHPFYTFTCLGGGGCELDEYVVNVHRNGQLIYQDSTMFAYCPTLSNEDVFQTYGLTVSPNPVNQTFSIQSTISNQLTIKASLYNNIGQQVWDLPHLKLNELVDVSHLPAGVYLFRIETEKGSGSQKIVIQR